MCGFAGFVTPRPAAPESADDSARIATLKRMTSRIAHRGPDADGHWISVDRRAYLGHRRLSIIDLSPLGAQPMLSHDGRYCIDFNGEIYNYLDLRSELENEGVRFRGHSDTEVLVELIARLGLERTLPKLNGMFALAIWDMREATLSLARDRFGEKPLYYGWAGSCFVFGSELKALREHPEFSSEIDPVALAEFVRLGYVPAPRSIYQGIAKLEPGAYLTLPVGSSHSRETPTIRHYYSAAEDCARAVREPFPDDVEQAERKLETLLEDAVRIRMQADVPLGAFLSGGIDSSLIVALMRKHSARPVQTFSIGFREPGYDEAQHARAVAAHLGTQHHDLYVEPEEARAVIPMLPEMYDEPFADSSQIPTYLVSKLTREHVTVSLSGDAGDELFGGYNRYLWAEKIRRHSTRFPRWFVALEGAALGALSPGMWDAVFRAAGPVLPRKLRASHPADKILKLRRALVAPSEDALYRTLVSTLPQPERVLNHAPARYDLEIARPELGGFRNRMMFEDLVTYLPDDILAKVDRASMATSLEARVPFLDPRVVEFAWRLPADFKIRDGRTKWILRRILDRHVPRALIDRPKMGFGVPIDAWLRGPLKPWADALLASEKLRKEGFFDPAGIQTLWEQHQRGSSNQQHALWNLLMFQSWRERWLTIN